jgi:hypothetical protein
MVMSVHCIQNNSKSCKPKPCRTDNQPRNWQIKSAQFHNARVTINAPAQGKSTTAAIGADVDNGK